MARKAVDQELNRQRIIDGARELFAVKGYEQVSMRSIAQKLGYSHGAIYYHFKDKAELFKAIVAQDLYLLDQMMEKELEGNEHTGREKLSRLMLSFIEFGISHPHHYEVMFLIKEKEAEKGTSEHAVKILERFAQGVKAVKQDISPSDNWILYLSLHGFVTHYIKRGDSTYSVLEPFAKKHVRFLIERL